MPNLDAQNSAELIDRSLENGDCCPAVLIEMGKPTHPSRLRIR